MSAAGHLPTLVNVVHTLNPGGAERLVCDMSVELSSDYRVVVLCLDAAGAWAENLRKQGIPVYEMRRQPGIDMYLAFRVARKLRKLGADIIHAHQTTPWFYGALSRLFWRRPRLLFEEHGRFYPEPDSSLRRLLNRSLIAPLTTVTVAVSAETRDRLVRYEGLRRRRIRVIYNGTHRKPRPSADEVQEMRGSFGFAPEHFVVGYVGRLDPVKNVSVLIDSVARLTERMPNLRCLIVGDGEEMASLCSKIETQDLHDKVVLAGYRADANAVVHGFDAFVLPSSSEGTSMALLEAMAAAVPTIATSVGGNVELLEDGVSGYLIRPGSAEELADAILEVNAEPRRSAAIATAARERFESHFSFDTMIAEYRRVYDEMCPRDTSG